jgi:alanine racemase
LELEGLYTHFASAEDDAKFSAAQSARFREVLDALAAAGLRPPLVHANNSAALLRMTGTAFNLVRPGLLVYGVLPGTRGAAELSKHVRPVLSFKCRVSLIKQISAGSSLSYGRAFIAPRRMRVATITAGYGDGFPRAASDRAFVLIRGRRCRVLGRVTMDQTLVDVSRLRTVAVGDEVVLIGEQGRECIPATKLALRCGTIPWEILTGITQRVPRLYRGGQAS